MSVVFTAGVTHARSQFNATNAPGTGISVPIQVDAPGNTPVTLPIGTAAGQFNNAWADGRTLTATSVTLDLTALAAAATNTGAAAFTSLIDILICNDAAVDSSSNLTVGNAASLQFAFNGVGSTSTHVIKPGGTLKITDMSTLGLVCSTNKNLKLDAGAGTVPFRIYLMGRS